MRKCVYVYIMFMCIHRYSKTQRCKQVTCTGIHNVRVYMYVSIYVYVHICVYVHRYIHIYICMYVYMYIGVCMYVVESYEIVAFS